MKELLTRAGEQVVGAARQVATDLAPHARGGLLDLQNAVVHAFPESQQQQTVLGMPGVPTPAEVDFAARVAAAAQQPGPEVERGIER